MRGERGGLIGAWVSESRSWRWRGALDSGVRRNDSRRWGMTVRRQGMAKGLGYVSLDLNLDMIRQDGICNDE